MVWRKDFFAYNHYTCSLKMQITFTKIGNAYQFHCEAHGQTFDFWETAEDENEARGKLLLRLTDIIGAITPPSKQTSEQGSDPSLPDIVPTI